MPVIKTLIPLLTIASLCGSASLPAPDGSASELALTLIAKARCSPDARERQALRAQLVNFRVPITVPPRKDLTP